MRLQEILLNAIADSLLEIFVWYNNDIQRKLNKLVVTFPHDLYDLNRNPDIPASVAIFSLRTSNEI